MNKIIYKFYQITVDIYRFFDSIYFRTRLRCLKYWHGGIKKIPSNEIGKLLPLDEDSERVMRILSTAFTIARTLNCVFKNTYVGYLFGRSMFNYSTYEETMELNQILTATNYRRAIYNALIAYGDITDKRAEFLLGPEKYRLFINWLDDLTIESLKIDEEVNDDN